MTPKRIARGPAAADAELRRWAKTAFRPVRIYGDTRRMREDALRSAHEGRGSAMIASEPRGIKVSPLEVAVALGALAGGFFLGRWWVRRKKVATTYVQGLDALTR